MKEGKQEVKENKSSGEKKENIFRKGFFKKLKCSLVNIEKYPELATEGVPRAIGYLSKLIVLLAIVVCLGMSYQVYRELQEGLAYVETEFPEFTYEEGRLQVEQEEAIVIDTDKEFIGKIIVDTKLENEEQINEYRNEMNENGNGILVLQDKVIIKNPSFAGMLSYSYQEVLKPIQIESFTKETVMSYTHSFQIVSVYLSFFVTMFIYAFIIYFINTISSVLFISVFGYLTGLLNRMKLRYAAVFNMAIYSITLSTILTMIYVIINVFVDFDIQYFDVMYLSVAVIYLLAAIFMLKADLLKKQGELIRIQEVQKEVKKEIEEKKREEEKKENKEQKDNKEEKPKEKEKKKKEGDSGVNPEPEGSNA